MYTCELKISLTFSFFEASVIVGGDGSHGQTDALRFHLAVPPPRLTRLRAEIALPGTLVVATAIKQVSWGEELTCK